MTNIRKLPPNLEQQAISELNEEPNRIDSDIETLRNWLAKQPHITSRTDDQFLVCFLRGCKYSLERAKEKLDIYYTIRTAIPEIFGHRDPADSDFQGLFKKGAVVALPVPYTDGSRIVLNKVGVYDPHKQHLIDYLKVSFMVADQLLCSDDNSIISGQTVLVDVQGLSMLQLSQATPSLLKKIAAAIKEAYPVRQKGIHFINPPTGFEALYKLFQTFLSEKLSKRLHIHNSLESLHKYISKSHLPNEYGGELGPLQAIIDDSLENFMKNRKWFLDDVNYKTNESKRVGLPKNSQALFGVDGSFRKLEVD